MIDAMEHLHKKETTETRLTQAELAALLDRWRDERENTVSVADIAEALHCSKAEIEALVWRSRAENQVVAKHRPKNLLRSIMLSILCMGLLCLVLAMTSYYPANQPPQIVGVSLLILWTAYATFVVLSQAIGGKEG